MVYSKCGSVSCKGVPSVFIGSIEIDNVDNVSAFHSSAGYRGKLLDSTAALLQMCVGWGPQAAPSNHHLQGVRKEPVREREEHRVSIDETVVSLAANNSGQLINCFINS